MTNGSTIDQELKSLAAKLTEEIRQDKSEVETRQKRILKNEDLLRAVKSRLATSDSGQTGYGAKAGVVLDAINRIPKNQFTQEDVEAAIKQLSPELEINRDRIRSVLWTFANKTHKVKVVKKGTGNEPAVYEKGNGVLVRYRREAPSKKPAVSEGPDLPVVAAAASGQVIASALENAVRTKSGRVEHLANRLNTDEATIRSLLEPNSRVYVAPAGWLRVRE